MELTIEAYKPNTIIEVDAKIIDSTTDLRNSVYIKTGKDNYLLEKEHKMRQEFNEYLYDNYGKRGCVLTPYIKDKLWKRFVFDKNREETGFLNYLSNLWEKIEDTYL